MSDGLVILLGKTDIINSFHKQVRCYPRKVQDENVYIQYDFNFRARETVLVTQLCPTPWDLVDCSLPGSSVHGDSLGKNTRVGCHNLFQGIFPAQGLSPCLLHCRQILYHLSHQESPRILEGVTYPFSRRSSWPRSGTGVSCIAGKFFTSWATREDRARYLLLL